MEFYNVAVIAVSLASLAGAYGLFRDALKGTPNQH